MNAKVEKTIEGRLVVARPVFKGGAIPAYWTGIINDQTLCKTFPSAGSVFRFAATIPPH